MYCRICHYDLRGQLTHRCPECGIGYDPADPETTLRSPPSLTAELRIIFSSKTTSVLIGMSLVILPLFALGVLGPVAVIRGCLDPGVVRIIRLREVCQVFILQQTSANRAVAFDMENARRNLPPRLSAETQMDSIRNRRAWYWYARSGHNIASFYIFYPILVAVLARRRLRKLAVVSTLVLAGIWAIGLADKWIAGVVWPASHDYLEDYEFVSDLDWDIPDAEKDRTIIAYSECAYYRQRTIGYMSGRVSRFLERDFPALAAEQGIDLPGIDSSPPDP